MLADGGDANFVTEDGELVCAAGGASLFVSGADDVAVVVGVSAFEHERAFVIAVAVVGKAEAGIEAEETCFGTVARRGGELERAEAGNERERPGFGILGAGELGDDVRFRQLPQVGEAGEEGGVAQGEGGGGEPQSLGAAPEGAVLGQACLCECRQFSMFHGPA